jgi:quercetin dioxygenase-like cupin family protein
MQNKIVYVAANTAEAFWVFGAIFRFLITGEESGGSSSTMECVVIPDTGPGPHIHPNEEEQFYILEGELTFRVGDQTIHASTGDFIHIPRGTIHSFKNGSRPAKLLATFTPAGAEKLFQEVSKPVVEGPTPIIPSSEESV